MLVSFLIATFCAILNSNTCLAITLQWPSKESDEFTPLILERPDDFKGEIVQS